jgi:hypothetical protein
MVNQIASEAVQIIYDQAGNLMTDEQRYQLLWDKLTELDDNAQWQSESKAGANSVSGQKGGGRDNILNTHEKGSRGKPSPLSGVRFGDVCTEQLHTGVCPRGSSCGLTHVTDKQRKAYPMCKYDPCKKGLKCKFKHLSDTNNLAAEEPPSVQAKEHVATTESSSKSGKKKKEPVLMVRSVDDLETSSDEGN